MALPPLQPIPNLERLLMPDEVVIYTARLHPLHGWPFLLVTLFLVVAGLAVKPLWFAALIVGWVYYLPFKNFEMAITTQRILLREGRFRVSLIAFEARELKEWVVQQTLPQAFFHAGTVVLKMLEPPFNEKNPILRVIPLHGIWHPLTLIEAIETLERRA